MADTFAAIVLAAGMSRRMGDINKLHLDIHGTPLLRQTIKTLLEAKIENITVVLGYEADITQQLIADLPVKTILNVDYEEGQMTSVHCGLSSIANDIEGIFIVLGDQPYLQKKHIQDLCEAFSKRPNGDVVVPFYKGKRGNPIVISKTCRDSILLGKRNLGCRRFIEKNPELVFQLEMNDAAIVSDLDTPEDYQQLLEVGV
jgi:molybdenum cofactor cytidylyltransferase